MSPSNIRNCFPFPPKAGEWWNCPHALRLNSNDVSALQPFSPPMPAESIAPVVLQILIFKPLPFCIRNFYVPICLPLYTIYNKDKHMSFISVIPTTWTHESQCYGHCSIHHWWAPGGVNTQIILHILDHVPCFIISALENVKLKII